MALVQHSRYGLSLRFMPFHFLHCEALNKSAFLPQAVTVTISPVLNFIISSLSQVDLSHRIYQPRYCYFRFNRCQSVSGPRPKQSQRRSYVTDSRPDHCSYKIMTVLASSDNPHIMLSSNKLKEIRLSSLLAQYDVSIGETCVNGKVCLDKTPVSDTEATAFQQAIESCSQCLLDGGLLGVPTDTIYGFAGLAQSNDAVKRIYDIKKRNYSKPVAISVGIIDDIYRWSQVTVPRQLLCDLLPGPVTVVFERSQELNPALNPDTSLVGIRIPDHKFMKELAIQCGSPIALTSANISGDKSCLDVKEFEHLWPVLDFVVNGGKLNNTEESRLGSTVVDLSTNGTFRIIRPGSAHSGTVAVLQDKYGLKERKNDDS